MVYKLYILYFYYNNLKNKFKKINLKKFFIKNNLKI